MGNCSACAGISGGMGALSGTVVQAAGLESQTTFPTQPEYTAWQFPMSISSGAPCHLQSPVETCGKHGLSVLSSSEMAAPASGSDNSLLRFLNRPTKTG
jgi:hypothetical protein